MDFYIYESDITVDLQRNTGGIHKKKTEDWKVTVVDIGLFSADLSEAENLWNAGMVPWIEYQEDVI